MKYWATLLLCALLAACATPPVPLAPPQLFGDALFGAPSEAVDASQILAVNDAMRLYLRREIAAQSHTKNARHALFDALYGKGQLKLEYDAEFTRNAAQAFAARSGNCLSLVLMTAAMAKEVGLAVQYQSVITEHSWSRSGDLYFDSGHVNLVLGALKADAHRGYESESALTIDFLPPADTGGYRTVPIEERTVAAMYMNNRAAETLVRERLDDAYWWARGAIEQDPGFKSAYNTLGVVFLRHGNLEQARRAFVFALERDPQDTRVMDNLAQALDALGQGAQARALRETVARLLPLQPFHFFDLGRAAMARGDYQGAVKLFSRELERDPYYHEFHFWLAQAYFRLGDVKRADRELGLAIDASTTRRDHQLYAAKLDRIKSLQH
ncbi:Tfp pilus assembly protein PilF [Oxalobacteraceae bacterium GrIS 1.11]